MYDKKGGQLMITDRITKVLLGIVSILLLLNVLNNVFSSKPALAVSEDEKKGRYQISAWAAESEGTRVHSGYYVLDTATGMVVASKTETPRLKQ
jgi:hypothetical protein